MADNLRLVLESDHWSAEGSLSNSALRQIKGIYPNSHALLTTSCTAAIELVALTLGTRPGDNVIVPSFAFAGCATPFARCGVEIRLADIEYDGAISIESSRNLIDSRTKAILAIHYAGGARRLQQLTELCASSGISLIEDCAHAFNATASEILLGTAGRFATFSFHDTKNISCGEGGALLINRTADIDLAESIYRVGTDQRRFLQGTTTFYQWTTLGGKFGMSEFQAAVLAAQFEPYELAHAHREALWREYRELLSRSSSHAHLILPPDPGNDRHGAHIFYVLLPTAQAREDMRHRLGQLGIDCRAHYDPLHRSKFMIHVAGKRWDCPVATDFADRLLRLPLHAEMTQDDVRFVVDSLLNSIN